MERVPDRLTGVFATAADAVWSEDPRRRNAFDRVSRRFSEAMGDVGGTTRLQAEDTLEPAEGAMWDHTTPEELDSLLQAGGSSEMFFMAAAEDPEAAVGTLRKQVEGSRQPAPTGRPRSPAPDDDQMPEPPSADADAGGTAVPEGDIAAGSEQPAAPKPNRRIRPGMDPAKASEQAAARVRRGESWSTAAARAATAAIPADAAAEVASDKVLQAEGMNVESFHYRLSAVTALAGEASDPEERMKQLRGMSTGAIASEVRGAEDRGLLERGQVNRRAEEWTEASMERVTALDRTGSMREAQIAEYKESAGFELDFDNNDLEGNELDIANTAMRRGMSRDQAGKVGQAAAFRSLFGDRYGLDKERPASEENLYKDTRRAALMELNAGSVTGRRRQQRLERLQGLTDEQLTGRAGAMGYTNRNVSNVQNRMLSIAGSTAKTEEMDQEIREGMEEFSENTGLFSQSGDAAAAFNATGLRVDTSTLARQIDEQGAEVTELMKERSARPSSGAAAVGRALSVSAAMEKPDSPAPRHQNELIPMPGGYTGKNLPFREEDGKGRGAPSVPTAPDIDEQPGELKRRMDRMEQQIAGIREAVNRVAQGLSGILPNDEGSYQELTG